MKKKRFYVFFLKKHIDNSQPNVQVELVIE
jgi:hypothetical protein